MESAGAEELDSSVCVRLAAEPRACQAKCWRSPNCWKLKATLEEDTLQGSEAGGGQGSRDLLLLRAYQMRFEIATNQRL